jgi:hypothetical protein
LLYGINRTTSRKRCTFSLSPTKSDMTEIWRRPIRVGIAGKAKEGKELEAG